MSESSITRRCQIASLQPFPAFLHCLNCMFYLVPTVHVKLLLIKINTYMCLIYIIIFSKIRPLGRFRFRIYSSETYESILTVGRTPWTGNQPDATPLPIHRTTQHRKNADTHPCLEWDSNPWPQCSSGRRQLCPTPIGHWDRHIYIYIYIYIYMHAYIKSQYRYSKTTT
jgi:hypothetical protein